MVNTAHFTFAKLVPKKLKFERLNIIKIVFEDKRLSEKVINTFLSSFAKKLHFGQTKPDVLIGSWV